MPSAEILDSYAGKYKTVFCDAALRFVALFEDEPWQIRGFEAPGGGLTVELRLRTKTGAWYSLSTVKPSETMADDVLVDMLQVRDNYAPAKSRPNDAGTFSSPLEAL